MFENLKELLESWLQHSKLGTISKIIPDSQIVVNLSVFTIDVLRSLWVKLVHNLSKRGLVNGVLDISLHQIDNDSAVIWVKDYMVICRSFLSLADRFELDAIAITKPTIPFATTLAIGGPAGVGKTTLLKRLKSSVVGDRVKTYIAYTTRPCREHETNGSDYVFVDPQDLPMYQNNSRFINFVEARNCWYWTDPTEFFESRWRDRDAIHVFTITQVHEFLERRVVVPDLHWVWLHAEETDLCSRLAKRGDEDVESSLAQNKRLNEQDRTGLVSLTLATKENDFESSLLELLQFITTIQRR